MKGDFSRQTFFPERHYAGVRMQQGRVQLDADWNEQADATLHRAESATADAVGAAGAPYGARSAFAVSPAPAGGGALDFTLSPGRFYVGGLLCEVEAPVTFRGQPDRPALRAAGAGAAAPGHYLVYLDAWRRHETALEAPGIREVALGGPDTATRLRNVWQVRALPLPGALPAHGPIPAYDAATADADRRLAARARAEGEAQEPCLVPPAAGYRGLENQLYRVEVHEGGDAVDLGDVPSFAVTEVDGTDPRAVTVDGGSWSVGDAVEVFSEQRWGDDLRAVFARVAEVDGAELRLSAPVGEQLRTADRPRIRPVSGTTWKWSRDNGIVAAPLNAVRGAELVLGELGADAQLDFRPGDWVEVTDDAAELEGLPGRLAVVAARNDATRTLTLHTAVEPLAPGESGVDAALHPRVRRWDGVAGVKTREGGAWLPLEEGVEAAFQGGAFRSGDHWTIPARTASGDARSGAVEWPRDGGEPRFLRPEGIRHHHARLAVVEWDGAAARLVEDARRRFPAATELVVMRAAGGDGQEVLPGEPLARPLRVAVHNGAFPVEGALVQFTCAPGSRLALTAEAVRAGGVTSLPSPTGEDGTALAYFRPDPEQDAVQQVTATLLDPAAEPTAQQTRFTCNLSVARRVSYDPGACGPLAGRTTVQGAVERLATLVSLRALDGEAREHADGDAPRALRVRVASPCGPAGGVQVRFRVEEGAGRLRATPAGTVSAELEVETAEDGTAGCLWTPDPDTRNQRVVASLVDTEGAAEPFAAEFTATRGDARLVAYDPAASPDLAAAADVQAALDALAARHDRADQVSFEPLDGCGALAGATHVQGALDRLASLASLYPLDGDGQAHDGSSAALPRPVRVLVASPCGPLRAASGVRVRFEPPAGNGTVAATAAGAPAARVDVAVADDGTAQAFWFPAAAARSQSLLASLLTPLPAGITAGPAVSHRFAATVQHARAVPFDPTGTPLLTGKTNVQEAIAELGRVSPAAPALRVDRVVDPVYLRRYDYGADLNPNAFEAGFGIVMDADVAASTVVNDPAVWVTLHLPYPLLPDERSFWDMSGVLGYRPISLRGTVTVEGPRVRWQPHADVVTWVRTRLMTRLPEGFRSFSLTLNLKGGHVRSADGTRVLRDDFVLWLKLIPVGSYGSGTDAIGGLLL